MKDWAKRIKEMADQRGLKDSDLARITGVKPNSVTQWWGAVKGKPATGEIKSEVVLALAKEFGTTVEFILTGRQSHAVQIDPETIAHAFVAVEKALRKRGIKYDAAQVPELLAFAYQERLALPPGREPLTLETFDRTVERELGRMMANESKTVGSVAPSSGSEAAQAQADRKAAGSGKPRGS